MPSPSGFLPDRTWWKSAVVYQIYPISFLDSNGDGIGDLRGIITKVDYLKELGVDVVWISPIYPSPLVDMGYDISDYRSVDPRYGAMADFEELVRECHSRNIKVVMDLVANHTSDEHEWFIESKASKDNPKRDWYIWRPPRYDEDGNRHPPNNWRAHFQGSAWEYDETTAEYYLHLFDVKQPDLNWENDNLRQGVYDIMRFWVDRGVDGFRMDVINKISKVSGLPDAPITLPDEQYQWGHSHYVNGPRVHEFVKEMHENIRSHNELLTIGETPQTHDPAEIAAYVLPENKELKMVFHFELIDLDSPQGIRKAGMPLTYERPRLREVKEVIRKWQTYKRVEGFWNTVYIENHDRGRSVSRFGDDSDEWRALSAKLLAMLQIAQSGTLFVYQGEELGLRNFPRTWEIEEYKDVHTRNYHKKVLEERRKIFGDGAEIDMSDVMDSLAKKARDHARTPMQWNDTPKAGFSEGTPWMRVNEDYQTWNVATQEQDQSSVLGFWKDALVARKKHDVLIYGDFVDLLLDHDKLFVFKRTLDHEVVLVMLNVSGEVVEYDLPVGEVNERYTFVLGNYYLEEVDFRAQDVLRGWEGRIFLGHR